MSAWRPEYRRCAGAILFNSSGHVLIGKRATRGGGGGGGGGGEEKLWQFPQGGVEGEEDFPAAAQREAHEELGIPLPSLRHVAEIDHTFYYDTPANSWLHRSGLKGQGIRFSLFLWDGRESECSFHLNDGHPEFSEVRWMPLHKWDTDLIPNVVEFRRPIYEQLKDHVVTAINAYLESHRECSL
jgi:putative (di)nucleoside polyphosphate hydrolase